MSVSHRWLCVVHGTWWATTSYCAVQRIIRQLQVLQMHACAARAAAGAAVAVYCPSPGPRLEAARSGGATRLVDGVGASARVP